MTLNDATISIWETANDHRSVFFVNRSSEWVNLKGTLQLGPGKKLTTNARIPPKATFCHVFLGESFLNEKSGYWLGLVDLLISVPDPYMPCFDHGLTWTCSVIEDPVSCDLHSVNKNSEQDVMQCRLNGKVSLKLNEDLGAKMRPLDSRTVFIDTKFVSSLRCLAMNAILEKFADLDSLSLPKTLKDELLSLQNIWSGTNLRNY